MKKNLKASAFIALVVFLLPLSCTEMALIDLDKKGEMEVLLDSETFRSALPDQNTEISRYRMEGKHSGGAILELVSTSPSMHLSDLQPGEWTIRVQARNSADEVLAEGVGTMFVEPGGIASLTVVLYDVNGSGTLDISLIWNENLIALPRLELSLSTLNGTAIPLNWTAAAGGASGQTVGLAAGFYKLTASLFDGDTVLAGTVEVVQIRNGALTTVSKDFSLINKKGEMVDLTGTNFTIAWDSDNPSVDFYRIYYREVGSFNWYLLGSTASGAVLEFSIDQTMLAFGQYELAVSSVSGVQESQLHTSMDDTALPATGWYVNWGGL